MQQQQQQQQQQRQRQRQRQRQQRQQRQQQQQQQEKHQQHSACATPMQCVQCMHLTKRPCPALDVAPQSKRCQETHVCALAQLYMERISYTVR